MHSMISGLTCPEQLEGVKYSTQQKWNPLALSIKAPAGSINENEPTADEQIYHVFIAHAGTEKKVLGCLIYTKLRERSRGICAFLDEPCLQLGYNPTHNMDRVVQQAAVAVCIMSDSFMAREAPMSELCRFMDRKRVKPDFPVIPVMYDLDYDGIDKQVEQWRAQARDPKTAKEEAQRLGKWANAVDFMLCSCTGGRIDQVPAGNIVDMAEKVVDAVIHHLREQKVLCQLVEPMLRPLDLTPVGLGDAQQEVLDLLDRHKLVVLHGMPGIGKTTLTKVLYNKLITEEFMLLPCHWEKVGWDTTDDCLVDNQKHILQHLLDLSAEQCSFNATEDGQQKMKELLTGQKLLLVLDDVRDSTQLEKLLSPDLLLLLAHGSKVIVTTRSSANWTRLTVDPTNYMPRTINLDTNQQGKLDPCGMILLHGSSETLQDKGSAWYREQKGVHGIYTQLAAHDIKLASIEDVVAAQQSVVKKFWLANNGDLDPPAITNPELGRIWLQEVLRTQTVLFWVDVSGACEGQRILDALLPPDILELALHTRSTVLVTSRDAQAVASFKFRTEGCGSYAVQVLSGSAPDALFKRALYKDIEPGSHLQAVLNDELHNESVTSMRSKIVELCDGLPQALVMLGTRAQEHLTTDANSFNLGMFRPTLQDPSSAGTNSAAPFVAFNQIMTTLQRHCPKAEELCLEAALMLKGNDEHALLAYLDEHKDDSLRHLLDAHLFCASKDGIAVHNTMVEYCLDRLASGKAHAGKDFQVLDQVPANLQEGILSLHLRQDMAATWDLQPLPKWLSMANFLDTASTTSCTEQHTCAVLRAVKPGQARNLAHHGIFKRGLLQIHTSCSDSQRRHRNRCSLTPDPVGMAGVYVLQLSGYPGLDISNNLMEDVGYLQLSNMPNLTTLPQPPFIKFLNLCKCGKLGALHPLDACTSLERIWLEDLPALSVLDLSSCTNLTHVEVKLCSSLKTLRAPVGLRGLKLHSCERLAELSFKLTKQHTNRLQELQVQLCGLVSLHLDVCARLQAVQISDCSLLESLNLASCTLMTQLHLSACSRLKTVKTPGHTQDSSVQGLKAHGSSQVSILDPETVEPPSQKQIAFLQDLKVHKCPQMDPLDLALHSHLQVAHLQFFCMVPQSLSLPCRHALVSLHLHTCNTIADLTLQWWSALLVLSVSDCTKLTSVKLLFCHRLKTVDVTYCTALSTLELEHCSEIPALEVPDCPVPLDVRLLHCTRLKALDLSGCGRLKSLQVQRCCWLTDLTPWTEEQPDLIAVELDQVKLLRRLDLQLASCLQELVLSSCYALTELQLPATTHLPLRKLHLTSCTMLPNLQLTAYKELQDVKMSACRSLTRLQIPCTQHQAVFLEECDELSHLTLVPAGPGRHACMAGERNASTNGSSATQGGLTVSSADRMSLKPGSCPSPEPSAGSCSIRITTCAALGCLDGLGNLHVRVELDAAQSGNTQLVESLKKWRASVVHIVTTAATDSNNSHAVSVAAHESQLLSVKRKRDGSAIAAYMPS